MEDEVQVSSMPVWFLSGWLFCRTKKVSGIESSHAFLIESENQNALLTDTLYTYLMYLGFRLNSEHEGSRLKA